MSALVWAVLACWLAIAALLAYRWTYTTTPLKRARRRNQQITLVAGLLAAAVAAVAYALALR